MTHTLRVLEFFDEGDDCWIARTKCEMGERYKVSRRRSGGDKCSQEEQLKAAVYDTHRLVRAGPNAW